jgi:hypothetical protein
VTPAFYDGLFATTCHNTFFYVTHTASKLNVFPIVEEREIMVQNMFDVVPLVIRLATSLVQHLTVFSCKGWLLNLFQLKRLSFSFKLSKDKYSSDIEKNSIARAVLALLLLEQGLTK